MKVGDKVRFVNDAHKGNEGKVTIGNEYEVIKVFKETLTTGIFESYEIQDDNGRTFWLREYEIEPVTEPKDEHYNNENGSLYLFADQHSLNAWEFDIIKRVVRCRKKGQFESDLEKTKRVIDLYLKESNK